MSILAFVLINLIKALTLKSNLNVNYYLIFSILLITISLKVTYVIYFLLIFLIFIFFQKKKILLFLQKNKKFVLFSIIFIFLYAFQNFASTGCFVYPVEETCYFKNYYWTLKSNQINDQKVWLELWAKAGATPNYVVDNKLEYISGVNWVSNWFNNYFFTKASDFILLNIFICFLMFLFFFKFNIKKKPPKFIREFRFILIFTFIILFLWFFKHPSLRYAGYFPISLIFATLFSFLFTQFEIRNVYNFKKKVYFLILASLIFFNVSNFDRIYKEKNRKDNYQFSNFPYFSIDRNKITPSDDGVKQYLELSKRCWGKYFKCDQEKYVTKEKKGYLFYLNEEYFK